MAREAQALWSVYFEEGDILYLLLQTSPASARPCKTVTPASILRRTGRDDANASHQPRIHQRQRLAESNKLHPKKRTNESPHSLRLSPPRFIYCRKPPLNHLNGERVA